VAPLLPLSRDPLSVESEGELSVAGGSALGPESVVVVVVVGVGASDAYAATATAAVPAALAATRTPVSSAVRRSPVSRFICASRSSLRANFLTPRRLCGFRLAVACAAAWQFL
jgi:hypothetical protein